MTNYSRDARVEVKVEDIEQAFGTVADVLSRRLEEKGRGSFVSRHEAYGIIAEEFAELAEAVRKDEGSAYLDVRVPGRTVGSDYEAELIDLAVATIFAIASNTANALHYYGHREQEGAPPTGARKPHSEEF